MFFQWFMSKKQRQDIRSCQLSSLYVQKKILVLFTAQKFKQPIKLQFVGTSFAVQYIGRNNIRNFM